MIDNGILIGLAIAVEFMTCPFAYTGFIIGVREKFLVGTIVTLAVIIFVEFVANIWVASTIDIVDAEHIKRNLAATIVFVIHNHTIET